MGFNATNTDEGGGSVPLSIDDLEPDVTGDTGTNLSQDGVKLVGTPLAGLDEAALPDGRNKPSKSFSKSIAQALPEQIEGTVMLKADFCGWYAGSVLTAVMKGDNLFLVAGDDAQQLVPLPAAYIDKWWPGRDELDVIGELQSVAGIAPVPPRKEGFVVLRKPFKDRKAGEALNAIQVGDFYFTDRTDEYGNPDGETIPVDCIDNFHVDADESEYVKVEVDLNDLRPRRLNSKDTNPKDAVGTGKVPMSCVPAVVLAEIAVGMMEGARKYGRHNYRIAGVRASVYYDAAMRHLMRWWEGEDIDPDSGVSHIVKALTSLVVLRDAMLNDKWEDDRAPAMRDQNWGEKLNDRAKALVAKYQDAPTPYVKGDAEWEDPDHIPF